ncbi:MAG TPA: helix-turn-helix transcriptional regulator [Methylomirabilota bacterium]|nr:helix-turn-helix transcriptional regulator [Methylomirabilota bacterium]
MADKKSKKQDTDPGAAAVEPELSLGRIVTEARERKGLTREQVVIEAHLPAHYVKMIETDSYGLISDQLYLVPFLRRYAAFLGLDAEDVASRFVRDVQHAEANVVRISQEITMVTRRRGGRMRRIAIYALVVLVIILLADFAYRRFFDHRVEAPAPVASPAAIAPGTLPPATIDNNPERAEPPPAPSAVPPASTEPPSAPKAPRSSAPRPIPAPATD